MASSLLGLPHGSQYEHSMLQVQYVNANLGKRRLPDFVLRLFLPHEAQFSLLILNKALYIGPFERRSQNRSHTIHLQHYALECLWVLCRSSVLILFESNSFMLELRSTMPSNAPCQSRQPSCPSLLSSIQSFFFRVHCSLDWEVKFPDLKHGPYSFCFPLDGLK